MIKAYLKIYVLTLILFFAFDIVWLAYISPSFYQAHIPHLLAESPNLLAAASFYLIFIAGLVYFAVLPAAQYKEAKLKFTHGAFFGLVTYATFDLTSQAVFRDWPTIVTIVDLSWGSLLSGLTTLVAAGFYKKT